MNGWFTNVTTNYVDIPTVTLTIDRQGTGTGGITATGLTCTGGVTKQGVPCSATYTFNTVRTLTAVPDAGSTFLGWGGACSGTGTCHVTMSNAKFVRATFAKNATGFVVEYYHTDVIGTVRARTNASGATVVGSVHDPAPFGEDPVPMSGANPLHFAGKELDAETAQHYFAARYYRQIWGRFTQADPASGWQTDPQSWNRYAYARNNPLKYTDPTGLWYSVTIDDPDAGRDARINVSAVSDTDFASWLNTYYLTTTGNLQGDILDRWGMRIGSYQWFKDNQGQPEPPGNGSGSEDECTVSPSACSGVGPGSGTANPSPTETVEEEDDPLTRCQGLEGQGAAYFECLEGWFNDHPEAFKFADIGSPSKRALAAMLKVLERDGINSVFKTARSMQKLIAEHTEKIAKAVSEGGYTSSMEREMRSFKDTLAAALEVIRRLGR